MSHANLLQRFPITICRHLTASKVQPSLIVGLFKPYSILGSHADVNDGIESMSSNSHQRLHSFSTYSYNDHDDDYDNNSAKTALVMGSSGSLGKTLTKYLSHDMNMKVIGADVIPPPADEEAYLTAFIKLPMTQSNTYDEVIQAPSLPELTMALTEGVAQILDDDNNDNDEEPQDLDAIISVAGGWEGDPILPSPNADITELIDGAKQYSTTIERMLNMNLYPLLAAGYIAHPYMTDNNGLFIAIGATPALGGTPGMLGYGISKVSTHHFVQTIGEMTGKSITTKSKRKLARRLRSEQGGDSSSSSYLNTMNVIGILPTTIDTPMNRKAMPDADFNAWTKSIDIAKQIGTWIEQPVLRPHSGSLVKVFPNANGKGATFQLVR